MNMNNSNTIENPRKVGGDYFLLIKSKRSDKYLKDFIHLFNIDDYWCYKVTNRQRLVNEQEFLDFKHSGYIFFKKNIYDKNNIDEWIDFIYNVGSKYLNKSTPPFSPNKVIIRENRDE